MVTGLLSTLAVMITEALLEPVVVGVNVAVMVQLAPAARLLPQVLASLKSCGSVPPNKILLMVKVAVPVFVMVTVWGALVTPTFSFPNGRPAVDKLIFGCVPVPDKGNSWVGGTAVSATYTVPVINPEPSGVNVTLIVHEPPAGTQLPHLLFSLKDGPDNVMLLMPKLVLPLLVRVTFNGWLLVPTG